MGLAFATASVKRDGIRTQTALLTAPRTAFKTTVPARLIGDILTEELGFACSREFVS